MRIAIVQYAETAIKHDNGMRLSDMRNTKYNRVLKGHTHCELSKELKFEQTATRYIHKPE